MMVLEVKLDKDPTLRPLYCESVSVIVEYLCLVNPGRAYGYCTWWYNLREYYAEVYVRFDEYEDWGVGTRSIQAMHGSKRE